MNVRHTKQILVVNGKGGCGKTTIATNLAAAYACRGHSVVIKDQDHQASSSHWHTQRASELPAITLVESHQRSAMYETRAFQTRSLITSDYVVIDSPSVFGDLHFAELLKNMDAIVVPILPSPFDIRASSRFLAELLTHRNYRARPIPVCVVANRVTQNSDGHEKLKHFLECLDVPGVATLNDMPLYTEMADQGTGIMDSCNKTRGQQEIAQWQALLSWLDVQLSSQHAIPASSVSKGPLSATRRLSANKATIKA